MASSPTERIGLDDLVTALTHGGPTTMHLPGEASWDAESLTVLEAARRSATRSGEKLVGIVYLVAATADAVHRRAGDAINEPAITLVGRLLRLHGEVDHRDHVVAILKLATGLGVSPSEFLTRRVLAPPATPRDN